MLTKGEWKEVEPGSFGVQGSVQNTPSDAPVRSARDDILAHE